MKGGWGGGVGDGGEGEGGGLPSFWMAGWGHRVRWRGGGGGCVSQPSMTMRWWDAAGGEQVTQGGRCVIRRFPHLRTPLSSGRRLRGKQQANRTNTCWVRHGDWAMAWWASSNMTYKCKSTEGLIPCKALGWLRHTISIRGSGLAITKFPFTRKIT